MRVCARYPYPYPRNEVNEVNERGEGRSRLSIIPFTSDRRPEVNEVNEGVAHV